MKYPYIVVKDGVWYPAGEEVPEKESQTIEKSIEEFQSIQEKSVKDK